MPILGLEWGIWFWGLGRLRGKGSCSMGTDQNAGFLLYTGVRKHPYCFASCERPSQ
jgi:hypothetical protein